MKVKLQIKKNCQTKLMFVKILKNHTGLGLKETKEICDRLHELPYRPVELFQQVVFIGNIQMRKI